MNRLSWVQPEDLVGHALHQAELDGLDVSVERRRWAAAGGEPEPVATGASPVPADPQLCSLAWRTLDEIDARVSPYLRDEPEEWSELVALAPGLAAGARPVRSPGSPGFDRVHGGWLGRAAGCLLGKPVEKIPRAGIAEILHATGRWPLDDWFTARGLPEQVAARWPWNRRSAPTSLAENIDGMPEDDDLNFPMLNLALLERAGTGFSTADLAAHWLAELPAGRVFTAERVAYRNLLIGLEPPATARYRNPFRQWIGAAIRGDVYGWVRPGDVAGAAELAWRDAVLTHTGNGVYGAMFTAALAAATTGPGPLGVEAVLDAAESVLPAGSRLAEAVRFARGLPATCPDFEAAVDQLYQRYGQLHWVHVLNNLALVTAALVYGEGDFQRSICLVVSGGWDTDSNGATVGAVLGGLTGAERLPARWTAPLRNRVASSLTGFDGIGFDTLARRTMAVAQAEGRM